MAFTRLILFTFLLAAVCGIAQEQIPETETPLPSESDQVQPNEGSSIKLSIDDCILFAVLFNRDIQEQYLEYQKTENDLIIDRSDFLPKIDLEYEYSDENLDTTGVLQREDSSSVVYSQRVFEFGKDAYDDVSTRGRIRDTFYGLQSSIKNTVSNIRRDFFYILLKQQQMRERQRLLKEFREDLLISKAKFAKGQILEVDVFTSELNVLNEELRINEIKRGILKRKMDLRYTMGCTIPLEFVLVGEREPLTLTEDNAINEALRRSFLLSNLKEEIWEKEREIAEKKWEYMPQLTFQIGYDTFRNSIAVDLSQSGYVWGVDLTAESFMDPPSSRRITYTSDEMKDASFKFQIKLPLFDGFKRREETARECKELRILRTGLLDTYEDLRRDILKDYQDYYEQKERLEIVRRRVEIAKRRLKINEKLKEFGKVDDNQLETFRNAFFNQQDTLYAGQDALIQAEEDIRDYMLRTEKYVLMLEKPEKIRTELQKKFPSILKGVASDAE